jgi:hypothetical protein
LALEIKNLNFSTEGPLFGGKKNSFGPFYHLKIQLINRAEMNTGRLAVFNAGRFSAILCSMGAEVAQIRRKREIVNRHPFQGFQDVLVYDDTEFSSRIPMFLLAGDLAGTATRAVIVLDKKSTLCHLLSPTLYDFLFVEDDDPVVHLPHYHDITIGASWISHNICA